MSSGSDSEGEGTTRPSKVPLLTPRGEKAPAPSYAEESDIHAKIDLTLLLPEGETFKKTFSKGDTVFNIKKTVHDEKGLEWKGMSVEFEGKAMLDPLSLNDFPALNNLTSATFTIKMG
mmetsp:Transcript_18432/g.25522  ORF Transcript_18432/g.25522 Transcript_18432/m.25522 type:complete len:118 (+) Transcript_18432:53-406(+)